MSHTVTICFVQTLHSVNPVPQFLEVPQHWFPKLWLLFNWFLFYQFYIVTICARSLSLSQ